MSLTDNEQKILNRAISRVEENKATEEELLIFKLIQEHMLDKIWEEHVEKTYKPYVVNGLKAFKTLKQSILDCANYLTSYIRPTSAIYILTEFVEAIIIDHLDDVSCGHKYRTYQNNRPLNLAVDTFFSLCEVLDQNKIYTAEDLMYILEDEFNVTWGINEVKRWASFFIRSNILFRVGRGLYQVNSQCLYDGGEINVPGYKTYKPQKMEIYKSKSSQEFKEMTSDSKIQFEYTERKSEDIAEETNNYKTEEDSNEHNEESF